MACAAWLERAPSRSGRRSACRRVRAGAAARQLDPNLHGQCGGLPGAVLPVVSARRPVRQAHGRQRLRIRHRGLHDRTAGRAPRRAGGRTRRCARNLRRRQLVRCFLRARSHGAGVVPISVHSAPLDASGDHAGHLHLYDVSPAGNASDSECDPDAIFRHHAIRRAWSGDRRIRHHAGIRPVVVGSGGACRPPRWRGLRRS
jgi:hypothetical protein